ncbi:jerky protein homolog-like [Rhagoletis pomonella]|uniref:jerky protein homolog-like n=1 Tax=Rhagoletis pomonella TaxID=28610 RepID=UPI00177E7B24|nr:jerky protein homolog-like [Rhagoletis pomonella]
MVIGKSLNPRSLNNFTDIPVVYKGNKSAWMTLALFEEWFHKIFVPEVKGFLRAENLPEKALLLIDNAPCHPKDGELMSSDGQISVMCLPPNCTALIQPMDQNVIRLTKLNYKTSLLSDIVRRGKTIDESLRNINLNHAICFLANAWNAVNVTSIQSSFQKLFEVTSEWDSEDVNPLSELRLQLVEDTSSIQAISNLLQEIEPLQQISDSEIEQWIAEPILESFEQNEDPCINCDLTDGEETNNVVVNTKKVTQEETISAYNICLEWADQNNASLDDIMTLQSLRSSVVLNKRACTKQTKISNFFSST